MQVRLRRVAGSIMRVVEKPDHIVVQTMNMIPDVVRRRWVELGVPATQEMSDDALAGAVRALMPNHTVVFEDE